MVQIVPSILSADFARLGEEIARMEQAGAAMLHVDIMDGHFVPNLTIGPPVVRSIRKITHLRLDVHLMITDPDRYIPVFVESGADQISVHQEACPHLDRTIRLIQEQGAAAGVVLNPATPITMLEDILGVADFVLIMSVNPGFGGQRFIPGALSKVRGLAGRRRGLELSFPIEIDGGMNTENLADVIRAGADWIVAGASIFGAADPAVAFREMQEIVRETTALRC